jgi:hypothetical protein
VITLSHGKVDFIGGTSTWSVESEETTKIPANVAGISGRPVLSPALNHCEWKSLVLEEEWALLRRHWQQCVASVRTGSDQEYRLPWLGARQLEIFLLVDELGRTC